LALQYSIFGALSLPVFLWVSRVNDRSGSGGQDHVHLGQAWPSRSLELFCIDSRRQRDHLGNKLSWKLNCWISLGWVMWHLTFKLFITLTLIFEDPSKFNSNPL
jgi:hypothetical protein